MYIGIDLGGTFIKAGIVAEDGTIIHKDSAPAGAGRESSLIIADIAALIKKVLKDSGTDIKNIKSIGIGNPGTCDTENGIVVCAANLGLYNVNMRDELQKYFDLPVFVGNDANCAALGEYAMFDEDISDMVFITLGTGVGGGIIIDKKLYTGKNGSAAEVGHMIIEQGGILCNCGARGCWEKYASVTALIEQTKEYAKNHPESAVAEACENEVNGKTAFVLAKQGDKGGKEIVDTWISYVATGILSIINLLQPELILIGGAISREGDYLLNPIRAIQSGNTYSKIENKTRIMQASLGNDAGLIGSAFLGKGEIR